MLRDEKAQTVAELRPVRENKVRSDAELDASQKDKTENGASHETTRGEKDACQAQVQALQVENVAPAAEVKVLRKEKAAAEAELQVTQASKVKTFSGRTRRERRAGIHILRKEKAESDAKHEPMRGGKASVNGRAPSVAAREPACAKKAVKTAGELQLKRANRVMSSAQPGILRKEVVAPSDPSPRVQKLSARRYGSPDAFPPRNFRTNLKQVPRLQRVQAGGCSPLGGDKALPWPVPSGDEVYAGA